MGYEFHITRADYWFHSEKAPIEASEWLALIERDPELRLAGYNGPYFTIWRDPAAKDAPSDMYWLDWYHGKIFTKHPDEPLITKMLQIAETLGAKVQGDEGETYPVDYNEDDGDY